MLFYDGIVTVAANLKALGPLICTERLDIYLKKKKKDFTHGTYTQNLSVFRVYFLVIWPH